LGADDSASFVEAFDPWNNLRKVLGRSESNSSVIGKCDVDSGGLVVAEVLRGNPQR
jgi:hypothetical protein